MSDVRTFVIPVNDNGDTDKQFANMANQYISILTADGYKKISDEVLPGDVRTGDAARTMGKQVLVYSRLTGR